MRTYFRLQKADSRVQPGGAERPDGRRQAVVEAQRQMELERQRLGRELHTGVGQTLSAMRLQLEMIAQEPGDPPEAVRAALERLSTLAGEAMEQVRGLSQRLYSPEWQRLTLEEAVRRAWELSGIPQNFEASVRIETLPQQPDLPVKVLVYRTFQEALSNLTRHSRATRVEAVLESRDGRVQLTIRDNGVGFDVAALESAAGIGLRSLREQAAALDARLDVESGPEGTKLSLSAQLLQEWH